jgi:uncharacterized protein
MTERTHLDTGRRPRVDVLDRAECLALLGKRKIGRLAFVYRALPEVIPVSFALDGEGILLRLAAGSRIAAAVTGAVVAFEVDALNLSTRSGWSVTAVGQAQEVTDRAERSRIEGLPLEPWIGDQRHHLVRIDTERLTGRWLVPTSVTAGTGGIPRGRRGRR